MAIIAGRPDYRESYQFGRNLRQHWVKFLLLLIAVVAVAYIVAEPTLDRYSSTTAPKQQSVPRQTSSSHESKRQLTPAEEYAKQEQERDRDRKLNLVVRFKRGVTESLKDPDSARFREVMFAPERTKANSNTFNLDVYCAIGFVNARNGFGGYTGFVPVFAILSESHVYVVKSFESSDEQAQLPRIWKRLCGDVSFRYEYP